MVLTTSMGITWELGRNIESQVSPRPAESESAFSHIPRTAFPECTLKFEKHWSGRLTVARPHFGMARRRISSISLLSTNKCWYGQFPLKVGAPSFLVPDLLVLVSWEWHGRLMRYPGLILTETSLISPLSDLCSRCHSGRLSPSPVGCVDPQGECYSSICRWLGVSPWWCERSAYISPVCQSAQCGTWDSELALQVHHENQTSPVW